MQEKASFGTRFSKISAGVAPPHPLLAARAGARLGPSALIFHADKSFRDFLQTMVSCMKLGYFKMELKSKVHSLIGILGIWN